VFVVGEVDGEVLVDRHLGEAPFGWLHREAEDLGEELGQGKFVLRRHDKVVSLNFSQFVEGRRWCPWARRRIAEARVFAGDAPCHGEEIRSASARLYALQSLRN
jgi:hypothetical protein